MRKPRRMSRAIASRLNMPPFTVPLVSVMFADLYVRLCSMGIWTDLRIL